MGHHSLAAEVFADAHGRRNTIVAALLTIMRGAPPTDREETILDRALKVLDDRHDTRPGPSGQRAVPVLGDLLKVVQDGPPEVRAVALDRGDDERYRAITAGDRSSSGPGRTCTWTSRVPTPVRPPPARSPPSSRPPAR